MEKREKTILYILLIYPIVAYIISFLIKINFFISILVFFGLPSLLLSIYYKEYVKKTVIFSILFGIPMATWVDFIMSYTRSWHIPNSIFDPFRLFGIISLENIIWAVLYIYFVVMFYEVFFDKHIPKKSYTPRLKYAILLYCVLVSITTIIYYFSPSLLNISYFYFKFAFILGLIPVLFVLFRYKTLRLKFIKTALYFFYLTIIYELAALRLKIWSFPTPEQYLGIIRIGSYAFPFEELFFWIILGSLVFLSYYEFFDDDRK